MTLQRSATRTAEVELQEEIRAMPAQVETMAYYGEVPWHGEGVQVADAMTSAEAIKLAGLDWTVTKYPAAAVIPIVGDNDQNTIKYVKSSDHHLIVRDTDHRVLGSVGNRYNVIQNETAFRFIDDVVGPDRDAQFHTAGSLKGGQKVWMLAKIKDLVIEPVKGDVTEPYLLFALDHAGLASVKGLLTTTRVVCNNTLHIALRQGKGEGVSIRHTGDINQKVKDAQEVLGYARKEFTEYSELASFFASQNLTQNSFKTFLDALVPLPEEPINPSRAIRAQDKITDLFEGGPGATIPGVAGTKWGALQAVTHYTTHDRSTRGGSGSRLNSVWFGSGDAMNQRAVALLRA